jgi:hypothetical protein
VAGLQTSVIEFRRSRGRGITDRDRCVEPSMDFAGRCRLLDSDLGCDPGMGDTADSPVAVSLA